MDHAQASYARFPSILISRDFADPEGHLHRYCAVVDDYKSPCWRVRYTNGNSGDVSKAEIRGGIELDLGRERRYDKRGY